LEAATILGIVLVRGACLRFNNQSPPRKFKYAGLAAGITCLLFVGGILVFGYWGAGGG
jgi:hypothetical protein